MNNDPAHDVVDAYVDALLDPAPAMDAVIVPAGAGSASKPDATAGAPGVATVAVAPHASAAALQPPATPTPTPTPVHAIEPAASARPVASARLPAAASARAAAEREPPQPRESPASAPQRWVRVTVGADSYALELLCVQEVVRIVPIVAMRGAARAVLGVMNLRGRIVPVFDLGLWLGVGQVRPDEHSRIVVVERDDELIGVLASTVEDVVTLARDRIEPPVPGADPGPTLGVARVGAAPTVLLDAGALYR